LNLLSTKLLMPLMQHVPFQFLWQPFKHRCLCFAIATTDNDTLEEKAFGTAIFGVMYTVCKEKNRYSWFFIGLRLLADWLQL
jgi:hypothetical protein